METNDNDAGLDRRRRHPGARRTSSLAAEGGDTMDSLIQRLLRDERARRFGAALAERRRIMTPAEIDHERTLIAGAAVSRALG